MDSEKREQKVKDLEKEVSKLKKELSTVNKTLEEQEQYSRRNCLRIQGIKETEGENTDALVSNIVRDRLKIDISPSDIDRSHRIMPRNRNPDETVKEKCIIVKFATYNMRQRVYQARAKLKGTTIFINEDLTSERQALMYAARKCRAISWTWSQDGKIFGITSKDRKRVIIRSRNDLDRLG